MVLALKRSESVGKIVISRELKSTSHGVRVGTGGQLK